MSGLLYVRSTLCQVCFMSGLLYVRSALCQVCFMSGLLVYVADAVLHSLKQNFTPVPFSFKSAVTKWLIALNTCSSLYVCPWLIAKLYYLVFWVLGANLDSLDVDMLCVLVSSGVVTCLMCSLWHTCSCAFGAHRCLSILIISGLVFVMEMLCYRVCRGWICIYMEFWVSVGWNINMFVSKQGCLWCMSASVMSPQEIFGAETKRWTNSEDKIVLLRLCMIPTKCNFVTSKMCVVLVYSVMATCMLYWCIVSWQHVCCTAV